MTEAHQPDDSDPTDLHDELDQLALRIERLIEQTEEYLESVNFEPRKQLISDADAANFRQLAAQQRKQQRRQAEREQQ